MNKTTRFLSIAAMIILLGAAFLFITDNMPLFNNSTSQDSGKSIQKINYLALGDSYSIGESVSAEERWPVQLVKSLTEIGYNIEVPIIIAKTGWTTGELKEAIIEKSLTDTFDLVSLSIGVNNQYRGLSVEEYRKELVELIDIALQYTAGDPTKIFVLSIPDWGCSPFAKERDTDLIAQQIDQFNFIKKEEAAKKNIEFVDITTISRSEAHKTSSFASDGLHYSGEMHQLWVREIIKKYFKE